MECFLKRAKDGYQIIEAKGEPFGTVITSPTIEIGKFLVPRVPAGATDPYEPFSPDYGGLPFKFAELRTEEELVKFANRHGMLGGSLTHWVEFEGSSGWGEPLGAWKDEILAMHCAVRLWRASKEGDFERVLDFAVASLKFRAGERPAYPEFDIAIARRPLAFHAGHPSPLYEWLQQLGCEPSDDTEGAPSLEYKQFQESMKCLNLSPAFRQGMSTLRKLVNHKLESGLRRRLFWSPDGRNLELRDSPIGLLGAMWALLAQAITNNREHTRCLQCGTWIAVSKLHRQGLYYCSDSCRQKAYRRRKKSGK